jgi:hypothetical protein
MHRHISDRTARLILAMITGFSLGMAACASEGGGLARTPASVPSDPATDVPLGRRLEPRIILGDGSDSIYFDDIRGYGTDSRGHIWVAEYSSVFQEFDPAGKLLRRYDRKGEGPAQFRQVVGLEVDPRTDRMLVKSTGHVTWVTTAFTEIRRLFPLGGGVGGLGGTKRDPVGTGFLMARTQRRDSASADDVVTRWATGVLVRTDDWGISRDTLADLRGGWVRTLNGGTGVPEYFGREIWYPLPTGELLVGDGQASYAVHLLSTSGDTIRTFTRDVPEEDVPEIPGMHRGYVAAALFDPYRNEVLLCRTRPFGKGPVDPLTIDYFSMAGRYLGSLEWDGCPQHVGADGTIYVRELGDRRIDILKGFRYAGEKAPR